ncbi:small acid-soluble spore protein I (minor) [Salsuginibacillus halophilus]|uniref:Small, acid-soluble spore protein I n=1 Tax=Salsuginibacillus halophilus TaxID=517424 RepID=A0A2P8HCT7_9BACI|nr:small acid-soluble spore protein SspI [Salsuginibacillus halophilus]PSL44045.1 small acid-soluble spore protein I (minor) [Salsuginibacillus halophilus]
MSINLRQAVMSNISGSSKEDMEATIQDALTKGEEKMLPGLGVLFEMFWKQADEDEKDEMVKTLSKEAQNV